VVPLAELVPVLLAAEASGDATVTSEAYRRILVVFAQAPGPLRCKDVCVGVSLGTAANHTEGMPAGRRAGDRRYGTALAAGWPIATGIIEGACRHLVKDRLDITGARWGLAGAESVLKLRALRANGDFDTYWAWHEKTGVHPQPPGPIPQPPQPRFLMSLSSRRGHWRCDVVAPSVTDQRP
jgi:hypothetical protein